MRAPILVSLALGLAAAAASLKAAHAWKTAPGQVALEHDGQTLWQFLYREQETKPCFHPLALPGGPALTWHRPADHRWHCALWFSWKYLNQVNYWEEDAKTGLPTGRTEWSAPQIEMRPDFSARLQMELTYRPAQGAPVLREQRTIAVAPPAADGTQQQDWTCTFTALAPEVVLDRTPPPPGPDGRGPGGYAGLSVRLVREFEDVQVCTSTGAVSLATGRFRGKALAVDYSGRVGDQVCGFAFLDHPQNLHSPSPWYVINDGPMRFVNAAVLCFDPHRLKQGESFTLRYRVILHPGRWTPERLQQETARFHRQP
jgi:hypothetical protein